MDDPSISNHPAAQKFAALVFLVSFIAYVGYGITDSVLHGVRYNILFWPILGLALLAESVGLYRRTPGSRVSGMICSATIAAAGVAILCMLIFYNLPNYPAREIRPTLAIVAVISAVHGCVFVALARTNPGRPVASEILGSVVALVIGVLCVSEIVSSGIRLDLLLLAILSFALVLVLLRRALGSPNCT
jgi:hypothetical protein